MVAIDNELFEPAELTGIARAEQEIQDEGSLARWLPNVLVPDIAVSFIVGAHGLIQEASYRAYDAEPEFGASEDEGEEIMLKLPAISQQQTLSEYQQLRARNAGEDALRRSAERTLRSVVAAISATANRQRATVLLTGKATTTQRGFRLNDDFGRDPALTVNLTSWLDPAVDRLDALSLLAEVYRSKNNDTDPGAIAMSRSAFQLFARGNQFQVPLTNGSSRPLQQSEVFGIVEGSGLPPIEIVKGIGDDHILLLPAPGEANADEPGPLGATFWGQTLVSSEPEWAIAEDEQPGIVAAVLKAQGVPAIRSVIGDSISLPVAANANLSLAAKVR